MACGRRILPKAETDDQVRACLSLLVRPPPSGDDRRGVDRAGRQAAHRAGADAGFVPASWTDGAIEAYVDCGEGLGKAGGYAIQGRAEIFVKEINGSCSNVVGLPLALTVPLLKGAGFPC